MLFKLSFQRSHLAKNTHFFSDDDDADHDDEDEDDEYEEEDDDDDDDDDGHSTMICDEYTTQTHI